MIVIEVVNNFRRLRINTLEKASAKSLRARVQFKEFKNSPSLSLK